ncbi:MAG: FtsX-like permease family protein, partial [Acidobacteria bacterium]
MDSVRQDLKFVARSLGRQPGFTAAAILTLALGIAASTAIFSLVDSALLRALPFDDAGRLVMLWGVAGPERDIRGASFPEVRDWREQNRSLTALSIYDPTSVNLRAGEEPVRVQAEMVSASYFSLVGVEASAGRTFVDDDDRAPDRSPVIVISHRLWQGRFSGATDIVGRSVMVNDRGFTVVGVMPAGFNGLSFESDVWVPAMMVSIFASPSVVENRGNRWLAAVGRLRPGTALEEAQRDLDRVAAHLADTHPASNRDRGVRLMSLHENYLGSTRDLLPALFAAVLLLLLVASANVTSLQLVRGAARQREVAVRLALGATRGRLVRQMLTEAAVLALAGGALGSLLALWALDVLVPLIPAGALPRYVRPGVDGRALAAAFAFSLLSAGAFGLVPALRAWRDGFGDGLKEGARAARSGLSSIRRPGLQQGLVVAQVSVALVLLIGAALLARSLQAQLAVSPGFEAKSVTAARLTLSAELYNHEARTQFAARLVER